MPKILRNKVCGSDCTLSKTCKNPKIKMEGDPDSAEVLFVGEGPGSDEDITGRPFAGRAGRLLRDTIQNVGIKNFCLTNSVRCRPPSNRTPTILEVKTCSPFLEADIESIPNLKLIVPLGNVAMAATLGRKGGISSCSGKVLNKNGKIYMPILHPAYILRNQNELKTFTEHVGRIPEALGGSLATMSDFGTYSVITTLSQWKDLVKQIHETKEIVYDLETNSLNPFDPSALIRCIGFCLYDRIATTLPLCRKVIGEDKFVYDVWSPNNRKEIMVDLKEVFESRRIAKIGHNIKFDNLFMKQKLEIKVKGTTWDTKYSQFLLNENESNDLKDMVWKYIPKLGGYENKLLDDNPSKVEDSQLWEYNSVDCDVTRRIYVLHKKELTKDIGLSFLMKNLMIPVTNALVDVESQGIQIDLKQLDICEQNVDIHLAKTDKLIRAENSVKDFENETGTPLNPNSHIQLREVLFKYEGLTPVKYTPKKSPSTDREVLEELSVSSNLCKLLIDHSLYSSMKSKMIKELREYATNRSRTHTQYMLTRTATGRTSSKSPNLQNVTKGAKDVVGIRKVFTADPGYVLVEFDLNQHELRCMADEAGDQTLAQAILSTDVHRATAARILGIPESQVSEDQRRNIGKTFNFGLIYGLTDFGVQRRLKCDQLTAKMYIDQFFKTYAKTKAWIDKTTEFVRENGYIRSRTGRYRRFPTWDVLDDRFIREAVNHPIQSLASDILLYGLIGVHKFLQSYSSYICLEVHDSIVCNIHEKEMFLIPMIKDILLNYFRKYISFSLPLDVEAKIGKNWGSMEVWNESVRE